MQLHGHVSHLQATQQFCLPKRTTLRVQAAKGFGKVEAKPKPKPKLKIKKRTGMTNEQAVKEAVRLSEKPGPGQNSGKPPSGVAKEGRVDFAQVKKWRAGQNKDMGSLEVESFLPGAGQGQDVPYYNQLCYAAVQHQQSGNVDDLLYNQFDVPANKGNRGTLNFKMEYYTQYLVDLQIQHHTVERGLAEALSFHKEPSDLRSAMECYSEARGLDRSKEIATDLANLASSTGGPTPSVSPAAKSYVARLNHIWECCREDSEAGRLACLKLMTHAYCSQFLLLTHAAKVGAAFAGALNLTKHNAINLYRDYPTDKCGKDPFVALKSNTNAAGTFLSQEEKNVMRLELAVALAHTIQTLDILSTSD